LPVQKTTGSYRADYKQDLKKPSPMNFAEQMTESSLSITLHCSDYNLHPVPTLNGKRHKVTREINFVESPQKMELAKSNGEESYFTLN